MRQQQQVRVGSVGALTARPAEGDGLLPKTLAFLQSQLSDWRDEVLTRGLIAENDLNSNLHDYLASRARLELQMAFFKHQAPQGRGRSVDLGVHSHDEVTIEALTYNWDRPYLVMEGKRLPAPDSGRKREYVTGTSSSKSKRPCGGIERLKLGLHGSQVTHAALIGYVQTRTAAHWHRTINGWIKELAKNGADTSCVWNVDDRLGALTSDVVCGLHCTESAHDRATDCVTTSIRVHHFWIMMTPRAAASKSQGFLQYPANSGDLSTEGLRQAQAKIAK